MRALRRFTVRAVLPEPLLPLSDLVMNLRWSWHAPTRDLFEAVDPEVWRRVAGDPVALLGAVPAERLQVLAEDRRFLRMLADASDDLTAYLTEDRWYQSLPSADVPTAIGYFSMEYGLTEVLPQYSGGLGILAGDHLKTASDLGVPIVGVGLLYKAGYFVQSLSRDGWQQEHYPGLDPNGLPLTRFVDADDRPVRIAVGLPGGRAIHAQVWRAQVGRVPLLLLDSDIEDNDKDARAVTDKLYGGGTDHRLHQEMLLGIGGVRALRAWSAITGAPDPEVFHCNEGHAGFLGVERIRELVQPEGGGLAWNEAVEVVRAGTVFTTHTPVPAGIDRFPIELIESHFGGDNASDGVPVEKVLELGAEEDPSKFNMAHMGLRLARHCNGVAKLHGVVSRKMFAGLWPGFDVQEVPIGSVTNGVHAPTWVAREVMEIAERDATPDLTTRAKGWEELDRVSDDTIWSTRRLLRGRLVDEVRRRVRESWLQRGAPEGELGWISTMFDPDVLTIGFARRVPSYKRLTLMLHDPDRLDKLLLDPDRPIQVVVAGKSHPADDGGKALVQQMVQFTDREVVRHRITFLPNYDMAMARYLYWGCDVWLNNPLRPLEACGTSGMKSALNGGLNLSIRDGWWDEMADGENGWAIPSYDDSLDGIIGDARRDAYEAKALYDLLEDSVTTRFYDRETRDAVPRRWVAMVRHTLRSLGPQVIASRMLRDYVVELYGPAAVSARAVGVASGFAGAKELASWRDTVTAAWPHVRVAHVESRGLGDSPELGQTFEVRAVIDLAGLSTDDVTVEVVHGAVDDADEMSAAEHTPLTLVGDEGGPVYVGNVTLKTTGPFGYTVRVLPRHRLLTRATDLGLVRT
ncbi:MAG TPA: alpha-glucan family phosphorylase [Mycobacteriales bacterium]|nr:alpha-glucan family phosphorylase [Mycobacteriales bacterium]